MRKSGDFSEILRLKNKNISVIRLIHIFLKKKVFCYFFMIDFAFQVFGESFLDAPILPEMNNTIGFIFCSSSSSSLEKLFFIF